MKSRFNPDALSAVLDEQRAYLEQLMFAYRRDHWQPDSPYGGPEEIPPSVIEEIVGSFIDDFAIEHGLKEKHD